MELYLAEEIEIFYSTWFLSAIQALQHIRNDFLTSVIANCSRHTGHFASTDDTKALQIDLSDTADRSEWKHLIRKVVTRTTGDQCAGYIESGGRKQLH